MAHRNQSGAGARIITRSAGTASLLKEAARTLLHRAATDRPTSYRTKDPARCVALRQQRYLAVPGASSILSTPPSYRSRTRDQMSPSLLPRDRIHLSPTVRQANFGVHDLDEVHRGHPLAPAAITLASGCRLQRRHGSYYTRPCQPADPPGIGINGRRAMNLSRRDLAAAGVLTLGAAAFAGRGLANTEDEAAVKKAVEELKAAWLKQDKATLEAMTLPQLSYSHSDA